VVGGEDVEAVVTHEGGRAGDGVEDVLHAGTDALPGRGPAPRGGGRLRGAGEVQQVRAFGGVELQSAGQRLQHGFGDALHVAALQPGVVGDAHAGEDGDLLATQPGNPALPDVRQSDLARREPGSPGGQELADLALGLGLSTLTNAGMAGIAARDAGAAGGLVNVAHHIGGAFCLGILVAVFEAAGSGAADARELLADRVSASLTAAAVLLVLALLVTLVAQPGTRPRIADDRAHVSAPPGTANPVHPARRTLTEHSAAA
jgi:hypothetical protein